MLGPALGRAAWSLARLRNELLAYSPATAALTVLHCAAAPELATSPPASAEGSEAGQGCSAGEGAGGVEEGDAGDASASEWEAEDDGEGRRG